ncbi:Rrf2 family transcriptional regulator [Microbacterium sp. C7(2022)]|uniref:RrF2 family transcriptional regulator n=1 Tax=Microbacterium sp. C7(2022) TaxID=2992759 RepID=UPI00237A25A3|nr:Rrf2 family transcriptional regulator [Microbacterium sp. C7(2022)]MDE0545363.1 Rrf2 family transcriptional regulator [Microbacterium sp. C7(2022)]
MRISARADYAVRAAVFLARVGDGERVAGEKIATEQGIPATFLEGILSALRKSGIVDSKRGAGGGYRLASAASDISVADVIRAVEGPLVYVRDERPSEIEYPEADTHLVTLWVALRASVRRVLDDTSLEQLATGALPAEVTALADDPASWVSGRFPTMNVDPAAPPITTATVNLNRD